MPVTSPENGLQSIITTDEYGRVSCSGAPGLKPRLSPPVRIEFTLLASPSVEVPLRYDIVCFRADEGNGRCGVNGPRCIRETLELGRPTYLLQRQTAAGAITLDMITGICTSPLRSPDDPTIKLPSNEKAVLSLLMINQGDVVSRSALEGVIHDVYSRRKRENTLFIDMTLNRLRDKLGQTKTNTKKIIKTVKGIGFALTTLDENNLSEQPAKE